jgi:hypothetical protein
MTKLPTRSPTHEDIDLNRLSSMGLELEDIAVGDEVPLAALVELSEDRGRPASHYVAAIPLATELRLGPSGPSGSSESPTQLKICAGNCQRWGALDLIDHVIGRVQLVPVTCLDRCDQAPACELHGAHGVLVIAPASAKAVDEALAELR